MTQFIINRISELIPTVNKDWAEVIGRKMQKEPGTIRAYARGKRGVRSGHHLQVLKHLKTLYEENNAEIEKLTRY